MESKRTIYNLEFPSFCESFKVGNYVFNRAEDYPRKIMELQHLANVYSEFDVNIQDGTHAITGFVVKELGKVFNNWSPEEESDLEMILLILSIFTRRDVFVGNFGSLDFEIYRSINYDPRYFGWGGVLYCSIPVILKDINEDSEDIGFEENINNIINLISSKTWKKKYNNGEFLFLVKNAIQQPNIEAAFTQCWTIWEHLFAILNISLTDKEIRNVYSKNKIYFILNEFDLTHNIDKFYKSKVKGFLKIRNRLIHYGKFPDKDDVQSDAILFIQMTEVIIAKILNLKPSNVLNTLDKLEEFGNRN